MNRVTATILSLALAASAGWAADPPEKKDVPLPPAVVNAENAALAAADKARSVYIKAIEAEVKKLQAALEKEKQAATKAGNLELALAIKAKQEAMTVDAVVAKGAESGGDLLGEGKVDVAKVIVGKWGSDGVVRWEFFSDGTGKHFNDKLVFQIKYSKIDGSDDSYSIIQGVSKREIVITGKQSAKEILGGTTRILEPMK
jgi:hypothetical protein